jgi:hypothetical protein
MNTLLALLFMAGLVLAGSDGPLFPYLNVAGCGCWVVMILLHRRMERCRWRR